MLPTPIRNTAHAIADALAGTGGALSPFLVSPDHSMLMIGVVMGSITIFTASLVWMLPETRGIALGTAISRTPSSDKAYSPESSPGGSRGGSPGGSPGGSRRQSFSKGDPSSEALVDEEQSNAVAAED
jgi:hypothetical protein